MKMEGFVAIPASSSTLDAVATTVSRVGFPLDPRSARPRPCAQMDKEHRALELLSPLVPLTPSRTLSLRFLAPENDTGTLALVRRQLAGVRRIPGQIAVAKRFASASSTYSSKQASREAVVRWESTFFLSSPTSSPSSFSSPPPTVRHRRALPRDEGEQPHIFRFSLSPCRALYRRLG